MSLCVVADTRGGPSAAGGYLDHDGILFKRKGDNNLRGASEGRQIASAFRIWSACACQCGQRRL